MPYASISDMVTRFGQAEMIRLTVPQGQPMDAIFQPPLLMALQDNSDLIDSYVSKRYQTPMTTVPSPINRACCYLARYDLSNGDGRVASDEVKRNYTETIAWLKDISAGKALLPLDEVPSSDDSYAVMSDRGAVFGPGADANFFPMPGPRYSNSDTGGARPSDATPVPGFFSSELP